MEGPDEGHIQPTKGFIKQEEEMTPELTKRRIKAQREENDERTGMSGTAKKPKKAANTPDLSKKDLIHLLGVMEGEVQVQMEQFLCFCEDLLLLLLQLGL